MARKETEPWRKQVYDCSIGSRVHIILASIYVEMQSKEESVSKIKIASLTTTFTDYYITWIFYLLKRGGEWPKVT